MDKPTHCINVNEDLEQYIFCRVCGMSSYHPKDIQYRYCGNCKRFHPILDTEEDKAADSLREKTRWQLP